MEISNTQFKHCDLVSVKGRVDSATAPQLSDALDAITKTAGRYRIIVDLSGVDFISSAGLRVLIATQKECRRYNRGEVFLAAVPPKVQSALELAGFDALFKIHKDVLAAVGSF
jgi:anti-sigma B factor antagonist